jgi:hypothetical protein
MIKLSPLVLQNKRLVIFLFTVDIYKYTTYVWLFIRYSSMNVVVYIYSLLEICYQISAHFLLCSFLLLARVVAH